MEKIKIFLIITILGLAICSCEYAFVEEEDLPPIGGDDDPIEVSFSGDILPIFSSRGCIECHKPGGESPDLTAANAFQSINSSKYIDTTNPASSLIYSFVAPGASSHVWKQYKAAQAQYILVWIEQGAKNN
jgi:hypothetical protein